MNLDGVKKGLLGVLALAVLAAAGGAFWYFGFYTKTPEYALKQIEEAVAARDTVKFDKYVNVARAVDTASDALVEGMMDADIGVTEDVRSAVESFAQMFKASVSKSFREAIYGCVKTGEWEAALDESPDERVLLERAGLYPLEFRGAEGPEKGEDGNTYFGLRVYQKDAGEEYVLRVFMEKDSEGVWRAEEVANFRDFIAFVAKAQKERFREYLKKTEDIMRFHDERVGAAGKKLVDILHSGSIGDMNVRRQMGAIMAEEVLPDWRLRRSELEAIEPPIRARSLHRLRLKIADMRISYALLYTEWLETKKAEDIREANRILKEALTLEQEAEIMTRRMYRRSV